MQDRRILASGEPAVPQSRLNDRSSNRTDTLNRHTSSDRHVADEMTFGSQLGLLDF